MSIDQPSNDAAVSSRGRRGKLACSRTPAEANGPPPPPGGVDLRFLFRGPRAAAAAAGQVARDAYMAKLSKRFRVYYRLRPLIPITLRQHLQRTRKVPVADRWCFPDKFLRSLLEEVTAESDGAPVIHPWPNGCRFSLVLTHDVETDEGLRRIPRLAEMEEELGFRSSWNLVPYKYKIDEGLIRDLRARSFEIGIHGYNHDGRLYSSRREFERRAGAINAALARYGAVGFRSPMVHRNLEWLQLLNIRYDASCFDVDPYQAMPGGVGSIWPFAAGKFIELPYTLPQDHTLFIARGEDDGRVWEEKRDFLIRHHGMVLALTHPDYLTTRKRLDAYRRFLMTTREVGGCWHALPQEVARWWQERQESTLTRAVNGHWSIRGPASRGGIVACVEVRDGRLSFRCPARRDDEVSASSTHAERDV